MTDVKRYGFSEIFTDAGRLWVKSSDFDQLAQKCAAFDQWKERAEQAEAALVQFREQAAQVLKDRSLTFEQSLIGRFKRDACKEFAKEILSLPLPSSAERISKVLRAAEHFVKLNGTHAEQAAEGWLFEAVREWKEAG